MKRKFLDVLSAIAALLCLCLGLAACGGGDEEEKNPIDTFADGTYYLYTMGEIDDSGSLTLNEGKYTMKNINGIDSEGEFIAKDSAIVLYPTGSGGNSSKYFRGTISEGQLTITISGKDYVFVKSVPSGGVPSGDTSPSDVTVTFHANGGTFDEEAEEPVETFALRVKSGTALEFPEPPTKPGYDFKGWYRDELCEEEEYEEGQNVDRAFDLYAKWALSKGEYEVRFYPYVGAAEEVHATHNGRVTYIPEREGYIFNGWWTGNGNIDEDAQVFIVQSRWEMAAPATVDLKLYGMWIAEDAEVRKLPAPTLTETNGIFTWEAVKGAAGYEIGYRMSDDYTSKIVRPDEDLRWSFPTEKECGIYTVRIRSLGDGITTVNSNYSTVSYALRVLIPATVYFDQAECVLSWTKVPHADYYELSIDGVEVDDNTYLSSTSYDMSSYEAGSHTVTVVAKGSSYLSSTRSYTFTKYRLKPVEPAALLQKTASDWDYILNWDAAAHADNYDIYLNGEWVENTTELSYTISHTLSAWTEGEEEGKISFEVIALNEEHDYVASERSESIELVRLYNLSLRSAGEERLTISGNIPIPVEYQVEFDDNLSSGSASNMPSTQTVSGTHGLSYPSGVPTYSNRVFHGWYTEPECENLYDFSAPVTHDLTLYAGWSTISNSGYSVQVIDLRDHTSSSDYNSYYTSSTSNSYPIYVYFTALTSGTYQFYCRNSSGSSSSYTTNYAMYSAESSSSLFSSSTYSTSFSSQSFTVTAGKVYYLRFYRYSSYSIYFHFYFTGDLDPADGGLAGGLYMLSHETATAEADVPAGQNITINAPSSSGAADFVGWYKGDTCVSTYPQYSFTMPAEDTVVYWARYENDHLLNVTAQSGGSIGTDKSRVYVSFDLNGAGGTAPAQQTITKTQTLTYPAIPTRSDGSYLFGGWYENASCTGNPFDFSAPLTKDVTLYAKWVSYSGAGAISINGSKSVYAYGESSSSSGSNGYYAFVPLVSGEIEIHSSASFDTKGYLYDSSKSQLAYDDDGLNSNHQFQIKYNVTAGQLYYIKATGYSSNSGNVTIYVNGDLPEAGASLSVGAVWVTNETGIARTDTQITLRAVPDSGYEFDGWYENESLVCADEEYVFTMGNEDRNLVARFRPIS